MLKFYDTETREVVTEKELYFEFLDLKKHNDTECKNFSDYVKNCTDGNGTLEIIGKNEDLKKQVFEWIENNNFRFDHDCISDLQSKAENITDAIYWEDAIKADYDEIYNTVLALV